MIIDELGSSLVHEMEDVSRFVTGIARGPLAQNTNPESVERTWLVDRVGQQARQNGTPHEESITREGLEAEARRQQRQQHERRPGPPPKRSCIAGYQ